MSRTYKSNSHTCERERGGVRSRAGVRGWEERTHIPEISIQDFDVTMDDLQCREFVVPRRNSTHEEEGSVSPVYDLGI